MSQPAPPLATQPRLHRISPLPKPWATLAASVAAMPSPGATAPARGQASYGALSQASPWKLA
jgi:hypothetical protein